ncbi:MAG TPA: hypothetical protein VKG92_10060, partial [Flavobacteriales bacterium]|nr:hypothetical protein [Flavobacteriales bacterium]
APVLNAAATPVLASQNEDSGAPSGAVGTLVSSLVDFATPTGQLDNVTDADAGALLGIAITAVDVSQGSWWYTTNSGASWSAVGAVSSGSARLLNADAATRIYFQPNANFNGTIAAAITFRAWDRTSGSNGGTANTLPSGGNTAFSSATDVSALTVISVNDVPTATNVSAAETYTEDVALNLIDIVVSDADNATITATLTLSNTNAGSLNTATSGAVTSTYVAGTGVWTASGAIANVNTLLAGLTFTPASNFNGDFTIATSVSDGIAPAITGSKTMTGIAVNDAPQAVSLGEYGGTEDEGAPNASSGTSIGTIVPVVGLDPDAGAVRGIAIIAIDGTIGSWFYTTNNGTTWTPLGAVSATSARLLAANGSTRIHLQPNANLNGNLPAAITYRAWDQTSGTNGGTADVTVNGGSTAFSATPAVAAAHLFAINDAPVNVVPGAQSTSEETARVFSSGNGNAITVTDVDAASSAVRVTLTATNGTLTLAGLAGLSFTAGDGTGDATMTFTGTLP